MLCSARRVGAGPRERRASVVLLLSPECGFSRRPCTTKPGALHPVCSFSGPSLILSGAAHFHAAPTNGTKRYSFCCVRQGFLFGHLLGLPCPTQQNMRCCVVGLSDHVPPLRVVSFQGYHMAARLSTRSAPRRRPPAAIFCLKLHISKRVYHRDCLAVMVQSAPHSFNVAVLFQ